MSARPAFPLAARPAPAGWRWRRRLRRGAWGLLWAVVAVAALLPYYRLFQEYRPAPPPVADRGAAQPAAVAPGRLGEPPEGAPETVAEPAPSSVALAPGEAPVVKVTVGRAGRPRPEGAGRGARLSAEGRWREAAEWYRRRLDAAPGWADGWAGLATALEAAGRREAAAEAWRRLREVAPLDRRAAAGLALAASPERAERRLRALLREGREWWLLAALGRLRAAAGDRPGALAAYREALARAPERRRLRRLVARLQGGAG